MKCPKCNKEFPSIYYFENENTCRECFKSMNPSEQQAENEKPITVAKKPDVAQVSIVDFNMPFGSMVSFMVKWAIASIPAIIILFIIGLIIGTVFNGLVVSLLKR